MREWVLGVGNILFLLVAIGLASIEAKAESVATSTLIARTQASLPSKRTKITLKDLFRDSNKATDAYLSKIVIGNAPPVGEKRIFTRMAVSSLLRPHVKSLTKSLLAKPRIVLPDQIIVETASSTFSKEGVASQLKKHWADLCGSYEVDIVELVLPNIDGGYLSYKMDLKDELPRGSFSLPLRVQVQNARPKIYWISGMAEIYQQVPVLQKSVHLGDIISESDVEYQRRNVTYLNNGIPPKDQLNGQRVRRFLRAGQILWSSDIDRPKAIEQGDIVKVVVDGGAYNISIMAQALQSGYVGDSVTVKNPETNKVFTAKVSAQGEVTIQ